MGSAGTVYVIDPQTNTVVDDIAVEPNSIGMTAIGDTVYITNPTSGTISVIDTATNTVESTARARRELIHPDSRVVFGR